MEPITQQRAEKRGLWASIRTRLVRIWNAALPNYIDFRISTCLGPLYVSLLEVETDCDDPNYGKNLAKEYTPKFAIGVLHYWKADKSHFGSERAIIGYQLTYYPGDETKKGKKAEDQYWHIVSFLFYDFWFKGKGPIKLRIEP